MIRHADSFITDAAIDAIQGAEAIGIPGPREMLGVGLRTVWRSRGGLRRGLRLGGEAARIIAGRSTLQPDPKDWRFKDPAWSDNPLFRRVMQLHLAAALELDLLVSEADLEWRDSERAQFLATLVSSTLAPTNFIGTNPAAMKRLFDSGGKSLIRGARNFASDVRHNGGLPSQVDRSAFTVGEDLATTPGAVVYRDEICEVLQYAPTTPTVRSRPVVLVPPQIGRYYFLDLRPGRSFVEFAVGSGFTVFMISWRNPDPAHRDWDMDLYAAAVLEAIDVARNVTGYDDVNLLGFCAGGILTTTVLNHLAATGDTRVNTASFGVTLLDFDVPATIGAFDSGAALGIARARSNRDGLITGRSLSTVFALLRPNDLVWNYVHNNYLMGNAPPVFDILAWNADSTNLSARLHGQFLDIFENNSLISSPQLEVLGSPIDLGKIEIETYVTGAISDHLTPWKGCYRTTELLGGPSTFILSNSGHIASLVNPPGNPKSHFFAGPDSVAGDPDAWLEAATQQQGTWWEHWASWLSERSGPERPADPSLGSASHPAKEAAPGLYVRDLVPAS